MNIKRLLKHTTILLRTALLLGAATFVNVQQAEGQTAGLPDAFETMNPADIIGDGQYYYIQFYDGNDRSYLSDEGNGKDLRSKDYMPFAKNLQWTLEATGTDGQFYLKSRSGHYVYLDGSDYKGGSINKSALTATLRTNSTSGGGYDISTVSAPNYAMGRQGSSGIAPPWTEITSINHNNHRIAYTRLRIAKLKDNIAHIIYWQEPVRDKNGNVVDRNANTRGGVDGFAKRHYMTYSGTDASNDDGNFRTSTVSSRSSILTTYANWYLATAAAYHKDGLWTLEESDVDGEFFIKKYGTQDYLNGVQRSGDRFYLSDLGTKGDVYKLEQPKVNRYTRIQHLDESTEPLTADMFKTWDGYGAGATGTEDATVDFNVGNGINAGDLVVGTSDVNHLIYADLSAYSKMTISGTPGMQLRALMSRQESKKGPYVEKDVTIGSDGKAVVDLTNLELQETNDPNQQFATQNGTATVKMTYVNYDDPTRQYNEIAAGESARSGYNNISDGSVGFENTGWGVNYITYLQVDARAIPGKITKVTLKADVSGSTDSQRTTGWGVGYNNSTWSATMTYNNADKSITNLSDGLLQWTSTKSATTFENKTFDITGAFTVDALKKVATILVYETAAAGGYIKNPTVEVEYTPYVSNVPITFAHLNAIKAGWGSPSGTISSITLSRDNADQRYLHHAHGDGWQVLQWSGEDSDYWYAGFYPVEVVEEDEYYQVSLKMGNQMVGVDENSKAVLKTYSDFNPELWTLEQFDDYKHFRLKSRDGLYYYQLNEPLITTTPTEGLGVFTNDDLNSLFTIQWLPKTETRIKHNITHKVSNIRLYYNPSYTALDKITPERQAVYQKQGLITDADSEWWDNEKGTQKVNEFKITHYVKMGETIEFGMPTTLGTNNDHRLYQRWYNYDDDTDLINLKDHFKLATSAGNVMSYLYNNGIVTGEKLDWPMVFPEAKTFESHLFSYHNSDGEPFTLAADVSRYSDFTYENPTSHLDGDLNEPSLTMRYIYYMYDAKVMARALMACTGDNWLEKEKTIHFPASTVNYEGSKSAAYQGEFLGIRHVFKDYWVFNSTTEANWTDENLVSAVMTNTSGHIKVVVEAGNTGITYGGKDNKGYYLYDEGKNNGGSSYGDSRFVAFKYPSSGTVSATGENNPAYVKVYFSYGGIDYQIMRFTIIFDEDKSTLPWKSVNSSAQVKNTDRDPKRLRAIAGEPIAKITFDYPTGSTYKTSSDYTIHNKQVLTGWWHEIANSSPLPLTFGNTNYGFDGDDPSWGSYAMVTTMPTRYGYEKTTMPASDADYGYDIDPDAGMQSAFLYIDASEQPGDICSVPFTGEFCSGGKLMCSGWISGSNKVTNDDRCPGSVTITVKGERPDGSTEDIYRFCPGQCYELDNGTGVDGSTGADHVVWQQFYFEFTISKKYERQWLEVNNNCVSSTGGDFMLDNIEVYSMVPDVTPEMNTPFCVHKNASDMQLLKLTVGFDELLLADGITEATGDTYTDRSFGIIFLKKDVFLKTFQSGLKNYNGITIALDKLEDNINDGVYHDISSTYKRAYEEAFDAALLGTPAIWDSSNSSANEGAGVMNFRWRDNFSKMDAYSFANAVARTSAVYSVTESGRRKVVMNGNYPRLPWELYTDYYIISYRNGITNVADRYELFNICSECNTTKVFQLKPPINILSMETSDETQDLEVCEGKIPTLLTNLTGYNVNGELIPLKDLNFDWWVGNLYSTPKALATLANYHSQTNDAGTVRLDEALSALRAHYPDVTTLDGVTAKTLESEPLTDDMIAYLKDLVDKGQLILHQKSISVPAVKASDDDPYFYLVACPIHDAKFTETLGSGADYVAYYCDEPQGLRMKVGDKAPSLKCGFVANENGFASYDYSAAENTVLSIRLAKKAQFETVQHGTAVEAPVEPTEANGPTAPKADQLHYLWLPIRDAEVQSTGSTKVISKSADYNIYLASTDDPTWDSNIYDAMTAVDDDGKSIGTLPIVGKIVQLNAIDVDKNSGINEVDKNRLCIYFTSNFDVREGYNYMLSLPFKESPGLNTCDGTLLINLKIVPDYEVWTGGAGNTDWNNDENWRRADGNTESTSSVNNNELYVSSSLPSTSGLYNYTTNYDNYRTDNDRLVRKGFAPLYCTHILLKSDEGDEAPVLYDAFNGKNSLDAAPFANLSENVKTVEYVVGERYESIAELDGKTFAIVNEADGKALYGTNAQNLGYNTYDKALNRSNSGYYYKLVSVDGKEGQYLLRLQTPDGSDYEFDAPWGGHYDGYLNSQPEGIDPVTNQPSDCSFILGLNNQYGQDGENLALWELELRGSGKFALKNVGTGKYLKDNSHAIYADPTDFTLCKLKGETVVTSETKPNVLKYDMQARSWDIWEETYGANSRPTYVDDESNTIVKGRSGDLLAEMYQINSCDEIAIQPSAELLNAHLLNYNNAWVEYLLDNNRWYLLGSPLQGTIAGEWYAPTGTAQQKTTYYENVTFGTGYDRYSPAIYQRSWDKAKAVLYEVGSTYSPTDNPNDLVGESSGSSDSYLESLGYKSLGNNKANVAIKGVWSNTYNDATVDYTNGGFSVMVNNGMKNNDTSGGTSIIRLPKEDTMYDYYRFDQTGTADGGTNTNLSDIQNPNGLNRALNRGRLKTDRLLPTSTHKTESAASRYGDTRTYTRIPIKEAALTTMLNGIRSHEETVSVGASDLGYYLVGNPFPCGLNMDEFFKEEGNPGLVKKYWLLTATGLHLVQRAEATGEWISPSGDDFVAAHAVLAPGQGFFVKAKSNVTNANVIKFTSAMQDKTRNGEITYPLKARTRSAESDSPLGLVITAQRDKDQSCALVMQREQASNDFMPEEDTETFICSEDLKQVPMVYTLCGRLATTINSIHDFSCLPLGVESASDAPCTLTFQGVEALGDSISFYDAVEQKLTPLQSGMQFAVSGQTQNRYYLVRSLNQEKAAEETHLQIFTKGIVATVIASTQEPITSVRCYDTAGRLVHTANPQTEEYSFTLPRVGIYIIEAETENDRKVKKVMTK